MRKILIELVLEMDATKMSFETEYFDIIIDKGTLDALIVCIF